jgi:hypothetical protein
MLAIVPKTPTAAATGFTTFRAPLFGIARLYPVRLEAGWSGIRTVNCVGPVDPKATASRWSATRPDTSGVT